MAELPQNDGMRRFLRNISRPFRPATEVIPAAEVLKRYREGATPSGGVPVLPDPAQKTPSSGQPVVPGAGGVVPGAGGAHTPTPSARPIHPGLGKAVQDAQAKPANQPSGANPISARPTAHAKSGANPTIAPAPAEAETEMVEMPPPYPPEVQAVINELKRRGSDTSRFLVYACDEIGMDSNGLIMRFAFRPDPQSPIYRLRVTMNKGQVLMMKPE
ncbi:hypothetical protein LBMAG53_02550 [Planctomycetota bacterium]|nr:hypothetical protein LBMAG53_02550 [Planctomycetota bacterium]